MRLFGVVVVVVVVCVCVCVRVCVCVVGGGPGEVLLGGLMQSCYGTRFQETSGIGRAGGSGREVLVAFL